MLAAPTIVQIRRVAQAEIDRRKRLAEQKAAAEDDLLVFIRMMWHAVEPATKLREGWVLEALADHLMAVDAGHIRRLIVNVFPGAMKSLTLNTFYPAWQWGPRRKPHLRYISASYASYLTERDNGRFRRVISHPDYTRCWGDVFGPGAKWGDLKVENDKTGWKLATSVGGIGTGERGDAVLIDDANNPKDVESDAILESTELWLREIMPDRLNDLSTGAIVNIQQRTSERDATSILAEHGTDYTWLMIPMEFDPMRFSGGATVLKRDEAGEPTDWWMDPRGLDENGEELPGLYEDDTGKTRLRPGSPMARAEGTLAWPERFTPEAVAEQARIKGPVAYAGQYQQSPSARGGNIIRRDWWQPWTADEFPAFGTVVASLDTAVEEKTQHDYNALVVMGAFPGPVGEPKLMLRAAWQERMSLAKLVERVATTCRDCKVDYLVIERKTRGKDVADEIARLYQNASWQTVLIVPSGDKVTRAHSVSHMWSGDMKTHKLPGGEQIETWSGGLIYAPDRDWAEMVIGQCESFPRGSHDDLVDATVQLVSWVRRNGVALRKVEHEEAELEKRRYRKPLTIPYAIK